MSNCGVCGASSFDELFRATDVNFRTTAEEYSIARCRSCGVVQTLPAPPEQSLGQYYPPSYYPLQVMTPRQYERNVGRYQRDKMALVRSVRAGGRLLDVGCGAGYFVREARRQGYEAEGLEFSQEAADFGRKQWNLPITNGDLLHSAFADGSYDIVTLWQVLEHLVDPAGSLRAVRRILSPGGTLITAVPNFASVQARLFRQRWYHLDAPRHLFHFEPATLRTLLKAVGFSVVAESHRSREHNWAGFLMSAVPLPHSPALSARLFRRLIGGPCARLAAGIESAAGWGGTITMIAIKN